MVCSFILHSAYHFVLHLEEDHKACSYEYQGYSYDTCALGAVRYYSRARSLHVESIQALQQGINLASDDEDEEESDTEPAPAKKIKPNSSSANGRGGGPKTKATPIATSTSSSVSAESPVSSPSPSPPPRSASEEKTSTIAQEITNAAAAEKVKANKRKDRHK